MKLNINFLQTGGVPLTNDLMAELMLSIQHYDVLGVLAGNLVIMAGCHVTGNTVSPGVVAINGEVLYFEGGLISDFVYIDVDSVSKMFEDGSVKVLIEKRSVKFGMAVMPNLFPWTDFVRLKDLKEIQALAVGAATQTALALLATRVEELELKTAPIINGGIVFPWRKPVADIPTGWKECTDFRGKTIVGWDPGDTDFNTLGAHLGEKKHTLTKAELPAFGGAFPTMAHGGSMPTGDFQQTYSSPAIVSGSSVGVEHKAVELHVGSGTGHNNIQPSRIAMYIEPDFQ